MGKSEHSTVANTVANICTVLGGALLLYPLIDEASKKLAPELEKLSNGDYKKQIAHLTDGEHKEEHVKNEKLHETEIEALKKKLAEYEAKEQSETKSE